MTIYKDLVELTEDGRIDKIGTMAMTNKLSVGFLVDDTPGKLERYLKKLTTKFPGIRIIGTGDGPVDHVLWVKVGPPVN